MISQPAIKDGKILRFCSFAIILGNGSFMELVWDSYIRYDCYCSIHDPHTIQVGSCHVQQQRPHGSPNAPPVSHCRLLAGRDQTPSSDLIVGSLSSQIPGTLLSPLRSGIWKFGSTYHIRQPASKNTFTVLRRLGISLAPQYNSNSTPLHPQPPANTVGTLNPHKYSQRDKTSKK